VDAGRRRELAEKARAGGRLSREDGVALYGSGDLAWLGGLAHGARTRRHGDRGYFAAGPGSADEADAVAAVTVTYGEEPAERTAGQVVDALLALRDRQDAGAGLLAVAPLAAGRVTGAEVLKTFAVARLLLDNVAHIRAAWPAYGTQTAQLALQHGADDFAPAPGASAPDPLPAGELVELIQDAGLRPVERDARYAAVREHEGPDPQRREAPQPMRF
jgi:aminodeoxyfutalosine synthase